MAQLGAAALLGRRDRGLLVPVGALVVAALPPFWDYATSGLETGLTFAWLGGSFWLVADHGGRADAESRRFPLWAAVIIGLGYVIRPDLLVFTVAFLAVVLFCEWRGSARRRIELVVAAGALPFAYQIFRMGYYALLVPNTALAKEANASQWSRGWEYLGNLIGPYWLWLPLLLVGALLAVRIATDASHHRAPQVVVVVAVTAAALVNGLYYVRVGGDFMHARVLLPSLFALTMPVAVIAVHRPSSARHREVLVGGAAAVVAVWALACGIAFRFEDPLTVEFAGRRYTTYGTSDGAISDQRHFLTVLTETEHPVTPGDYDRFFALDPYNGDAVRQLADDEPRVLVLGGIGQRSIEYPLAPDVDAGAAATIGAAGLFAYEAGPDVYVVDTHGLAEPVGAHLEGLDDRSTGHQKLLGSEWVVGRLADPDAPAPSSPVPAARVDEAREALACGRLRELLDDIALGLGPRRFVGNLLDSFANTTFRVPRQPAQAVDELC
jgi:arabinofuranosyltransferase